MPRIAVLVLPKKEESIVPFYSMNVTPFFTSENILNINESACGPFNHNHVATIFQDTNVRNNHTNDIRREDTITSILSHKNGFQHQYLTRHRLICPLLSPPLHRSWFLGGQFPGRQCPSCRQCCSLCQCRSRQFLIGMYVLSGLKYKRYQNVFSSRDQVRYIKFCLLNVSLYKPVTWGRSNYFVVNYYVNWI